MAILTADIKDTGRNKRQRLEKNYGRCLGKKIRGRKKQQQDFADNQAGLGPGVPYVVQIAKTIIWPTDYSRTADSKQQMPVLPGLSRASLYQMVRQ